MENIERKNTVVCLNFKEYWTYVDMDKIESNLPAEEDKASVADTFADTEHKAYHDKTSMTETKQVKCFELLLQNADHYRNLHFLIFIDQVNFDKDIIKYIKRQAKEKENIEFILSRGILIFTITECLHDECWRIKIYSSDQSIWSKQTLKHIKKFYSEVEISYINSVKKFCKQRLKEMNSKLLNLKIHYFNTKLDS